MKINNRILMALTESIIVESYKDVKTRFINDGADKDEVAKLLDLHKKLKDMNRLKNDEINIDVLVKGKSFNEFKSLMSRYSEKDTATKTDKWNALKNKVVAENDEWTVYAIDTAEEAYLFHGLTKWCVSSGTKDDAKKYFNDYSIEDTSIFFAIVRKNPVGDEFDYIMDQYNWNDDSHTYWDAEDYDYEILEKDLNEKDLNIPSYENAVDKIAANLKADVKNTVLKKLKLNDDGTYSYDGSLSSDMIKHFIKNGKFTIKFKEVDGSFNCAKCKLTSLEGCPEKVGKDFICWGNKITSLKGGPKTIGEDFDCCSNNLTSLEGAPEEVGGNFDCYDNELTSLEGGPEIVRGHFWCNHNNLTSLEGAPKEVGWDFICSSNNLTSLEGAPEEVGEDFNCKNNKDLKSLDGIGKVKGKIISDIN